MEASTTDVLFVYGTLKRGDCRHHHLAGSECLGPASTQPRYRLYNCGSYPGLVASSTGISVQGELYRIDRKLWQLLDEVEGVEEGLYHRGSIELQTPELSQVVWTYYYRLAIDGLEELPGVWTVPHRS